MATYQISDELLLQTVGEEMVILDPCSGNYFTLDAIGSRMIELFRVSPSLEHAAEQLTREYDVALHDVCKDFEALLDEMVDSGLVQKV